MKKATAKNLLVEWALWKTGKVKLDELMLGNVYPQNVLVNANLAESYRPFCFKVKTNAEQTRKQSSSKPLWFGKIGKRHHILEADSALVELDERDYCIALTYYSGGGNQEDLARGYGLSVRTIRNKLNKAAELVCIRFEVNG